MPRATPRIPRAQIRQAGVRRYRRWRAALLSIAGLAGISAVWSHARSPADPRPLEGQRVNVLSILDGDTLVVRTPAGDAERVRLRGIDAPEISHQGEPDAHFADESKSYLTRRLGNKPVILQFDGTQTRDRYGRLLAFVYLSENDNINLDLVRTGHAYADRRFDNYLRSQLGQAEGEAREKARGLWKTITPEQMPVWRQEWLKRREEKAKQPVFPESSLKD